jgi:hypothetical protein
MATEAKTGLPNVPPPSKLVDKSPMFIIRNTIDEAQECIANYHWRDPITRKLVPGYTMFAFLKAMSKFAWAEYSAVYPSNKRLAWIVGCSRNYIPVLKRAAAAAGIIKGPENVIESGRYKGCEAFLMSVKLIMEWTDRAAIPEPEIEKLMPPFKLGEEAREEWAGYVEDEEEMQNEPSHT